MLRPLRLSTGRSLAGRSSTSAKSWRREVGHGKLGVELRRAHRYTRQMVEVERIPRTPVSEEIRGMLCKIAYGWLPTPIELGGIRQLLYHGTDFSGCISELSLHGARIQVLINGDAGISFREGEISGVLLNGLAFKASSILNFRQGNISSNDDEAHEGIIIEAGRWSIWGQGAPRFWIGQVEGMTRLDFSGNLCIERLKGHGIRLGSKRHFFFSGAYRYFLVQCDHGKQRTWHLIIDTGGADAPDPKKLGNDFLVLQFVLGKQLRLPMLVGVTDEFRTVAATVGNTKWGHVTASGIPPIPIGQNNTDFISESWAAVLFERISATWQNQAGLKNAFAIALEMYLDAMNHHLDFDYLRLQVALEAVAFWILTHKEGGKEPSIVNDVKKWESWVKKNMAEIQSHACDGFGETLYLNVKGAQRLPSGRVIPTAFGHLGIPMTEEMRLELRARNNVVHQGLMAPGGYEIDRDLRRVAMIRTMLVALIAKASGYSGAINGWEIGDQGYPLEPPTDWWRVSNEDVTFARRSYFAEEDHSAQ